MVVGEGEVHHGPDLDLAIDGDWLLVDGMKSEHGSLWKVDDGGSHEGAKDTAVADGEGAASHVLDGKLVVASLRTISLNTSIFHDQQVSPSFRALQFPSQCQSCPCSQRCARLE